jgi:O-antigen ligase
VVLALPHLHNDGLQELATGGVVGFALWAAILAAPLLFFARQLRAGMKRPQFAVALAGILVVTSYVSFGLTEVIFWSMKGSLFYALMVFVLMGFCLNAKEQIG